MFSPLVQLGTGALPLIAPTEPRAPGADSRPDPLSLTAAEFIQAAHAVGVKHNSNALDAYRTAHRSGVFTGWMAPPLVAIARVQQDDATLKFLLPVDGNYETESVLIPMDHTARGRTRTLCVSSQVGCAMGCRFCETAQMGLLRHLTVREIVQQFWIARHTVANPFEHEPATHRATAAGGSSGTRRGFPVKNIVFMGMGEPMDNLDTVLQAIRVLCDSNGCGVGSSMVCVSTVGRTDGIRRLGEFIQQPGFRRVTLAVSLNAPNDEIRSSIMPINRAEPMAQLREAMVAFPMRPTSALCVEYVLIPEVNDRPEHAREACAFLKGIRCSLNIIPYNPRRDSPWRAPTEDEVTGFVRQCIDHGQFTKRRGTKGRSAMAACGQLGNEQIRARKRVVI